MQTRTDPTFQRLSVRINKKTPRLVPRKNIALADRIVRCDDLADIENWQDEEGARQRKSRTAFRVFRIISRTRSMKATGGTGLLVGTELRKLQSIPVENQIVIQIC